jgi:hypothetical protein
MTDLHCPRLLVAVYMHFYPDETVAGIPSGATVAIGSAMSMLLAFRLQGAPRSPSVASPLATLV